MPTLLRVVLSAGSGVVLCGGATEMWGATAFFAILHCGSLEIMRERGGIVLMTLRSPREKSPRDRPNSTTPAFVPHFVPNCTQKV